MVQAAADGAPLDLSAAQSATFVIAPQTGGAATRHPATIVDGGTAGLIRYDWQTGDTATAGWYRAEVEITWSAGVVQTLPPEGSFLVRVEPTIG